jgi:hypothetical protein
VYPEKLKGTGHFEDLDLDERIILKLILRKYSVREWTGLIWRALVNTIMNLPVP